MKPQAPGATTVPATGRHRFGHGAVAALLVATATLAGCASGAARQVPMLYAPAWDRVAPPSLLPDDRKTAGAAPSGHSAPAAPDAAARGLAA